VRLQGSQHASQHSWETGLIAAVDASVTPF
jgi:hypothetical protein